MSQATVAPGPTQANHRVTGAIARAASASGIDFGYLLGQARIESSLNPEARAKTSSATGLFQFTRQTWLATLKRHGPLHGLEWAANAIRTSASGTHSVGDAAIRTAIFDLRENPDAASAMAAAFATDNTAHLEARLNRDVEPVDLYLAHFLGPEGAAKFLLAHETNPAAAAAPLFPQAANANRGIFYNADGSARSLDDIRTRFAARLDGASSGGSAAPPGPQAIMTFAQLRVGEAVVPMAMRPFEAMPKGLSLEFARRTYQRLSSLPGHKQA